MATRPNKKGTKTMDIKKIKIELQQELLELDTVKNVFWEYLDYFSVETTWGDFAIGNANGPIGWNDVDGYLEGETVATNPKQIAKDFEAWLIASVEGVSE
jgi:hypothetical protein